MTNFIEEISVGGQQNTYITFFENKLKICQL